jgi:hypothetical protein
LTVFECLIHLFFLGYNPESLLFSIPKKEESKAGIMHNYKFVFEELLPQ